MPTTIESFGSTSLVEDGSFYFLNPNGESAVELSYAGAPVVDGQFDQFGGHWVPIGVEKTATGYEVAWKIIGADQYTVWFTDNSGNYISSAFDVASGTSAALQSFETSFQQDLNGDGSIGLQTTVIEEIGSTRLVGSGSNYFLNPNGGSAVELSYAGAPVSDGQFDQYGGHWVPIAAEQTATGYEVAWKIPGTDQYTVWFTDSSGNYISSAFDVASGTSAALQSFETSFHQDLNGDGYIGLATLIEGLGSTSLVEGGSNYFLHPTGGAAVELSFAGAPVVDGQFDQFGGHWVPIAAEQTATGYEVAWKIPGTDQYTVWFTDSSGNYLSSAFDVASGTSAALQSFETSFHQDLNGDGSIGPPPNPPTVIEVSGSTSLVESGSNYFLQATDEPTVELSYGGAPVVDGQFDQFGGHWVPIAAEQTATGYEVAWKIPGTDQYTVWFTDSSANYLSSAFDVASGTSATLQSFETSFQQDLNGDGSIGPPPPPPQFVYEGVDGNGAQLYDVVWDTPGLQPFAVRVLTPDHPSTNYAHNFLFALPVEAGLAQSTYGSGLDELQQLDVQDQYNATIIEPIFPIDSWYANNPTNATIDFETFMATLLPAWVDSNFATSGTEENLLIGFSKSGYGALDLLFKHPSVFDAVAAFDFPADMAAYDDLGSSSSGDYGTDANFQNNYRMTGTFIDTWKAPFTTEDHILISEGPVFATQVADFDALLTSHGVEHTLLTTQTSDPHSWPGGWLPDAVAGLYGLETDLHQTVIEGLGSTRLEQHGSNYFLQPTGGPAVELSFGGALVEAGQFDAFGGPWALIGAEQTASGYVVAWKVIGANQFEVWNTDNSGNFVTTSDVVSGTSAVLESFETSFQQDLNGDGSIGLQTTVIEEIGSTRLEQHGSNYFLYPNSGPAVELSFGGALVEAGQFDAFGGPWALIGAEQTASGYVVAWKVIGANQFEVWNTDNSGNFVTTSDVVSGTSAVLESFETSFQQDLNGDGSIGLQTTVIEEIGSTRLEQHGSNYFLYPNSGPAVELSFGGALVEAGQFDAFGGPWALIGAEQTASGYVVAWKVIGANQFEVWNTDNSGNFVTTSDVVSGTSAVLESFETSFQQDLNGDGSIGPPPPTVIEGFGSTSLVEGGSNYFLQPTGGPAVELSYAGAPVVDGQFDQFGGHWVPIGAEQTATGYEVAWKIIGADQYTVWFTDNSGNYISSAFDVASGTSAAVQSFETSFQQDLNGDGSIGLQTTVIEEIGSTRLVESGSNYFLNPNGGSAVELSYAGAPVSDGQFDQFGGHWVPIGAEQTATGYEVAWKIPGTDQYTVWFTDSSGNYLSSAFDVASGTSAALQSFETSFHQDLNGDGYIGLVLNGSSGGQTLTAGSDPTTLIGGPNDVLNGGAGADTFVFQPNFGANTVNNFAPGTDALQFSQSMFADAQAVLSDAQQVGSDVVITHDSLDVVTLHNLQVANLHASDVHII